MQLIFILPIYLHPRRLKPHESKSSGWVQTDQMKHLQDGKWRENHLNSLKLSITYIELNLDLFLPLPATTLRTKIFFTDFSYLEQINSASNPFNPFLMSRAYNGPFWIVRKYFACKIVSINKIRCQIRCEEIRQLCVSVFTKKLAYFILYPIPSHP